MATVECFINSVDSQMRQREEKQKLAAIASRIEAYEAVEGASEEVERVIESFYKKKDTLNIKNIPQPAYVSFSFWSFRSSKSITTST